MSVSSPHQVLHQFCDESIDRLREMNSLILSLESREEINPTYSEIMRSLHSMKGSSRMVGLQTIANLLHASEDIFSVLARQNVKPSPETIDALLRTTDKLQEAFALEKTGMTSPWTDELFTELHALHQSLLGDPDELITQLSRYAPETFQVLSNHQKLMLAQHYHQYKHLYVISISFRIGSFVADVEQVHAILKEEGMLLSTAGSREKPAPDFDLRFSFLQHSSTNTDALRVRLRDYTVEIREIPRITHKDVLPATSSEKLFKEEIPATEETPRVDAEIERIEYDQDFRDLQYWFLDESIEYLPRLAQEIMSLEREPTQDNINSIFRSFHNFKGSGGSYKFPNVSRFAHHLESFVDLLRNELHLLNRNAIDAMLKGVDSLEYIFSECKLGKHDQIPIAQLEAEITRILRGDEAASATATQPQEPETSASAPVSKSQESVRITVEKIDRIVNTAIELSIAHHAEEPFFAALLNTIELEMKNEQEWKMLRQELLASGLVTNETVREKIEDYAKHRSVYEQKLNALLWNYEKNFSFRSFLSKQLRDDVLEIQLRPLGNIFESFHRIVRDLSRGLQKKINLTITGEEVEVDRKIIEALKDPLIHLIRNAIDHGIETPDERALQHKSDTGNISIRAESLGYSFSVSISDDGRGLDAQRIGASALKKGLCTEEELKKMSTDQIHQFIFQPGFTTRSEVSAISGRGVGMDVVITNLKKFGGEIFIFSTPNGGTTFQLVLPCSLALTKVLLIQTQNEMFSLPTGSVEKIILLSQSDISDSQGKQTVQYDGNYIPVVTLEQMLGIEQSTERIRYGIILRKSDRQLCFSVPTVIGEEELMTKPLPPHLRSIEIFSGANILADGTISLLINPLSVHEQEKNRTLVPSAPSMRRKKSLLVVDDSFIARELLKNIFVTSGYEINTAIDGREALRFLRAHHVDLLVTDVEMPNMNGLELTKAVRLDARLQSIPVIIISARNEEAMRELGMQAGANAYIIKGNFNQQNLISTVESLTEELS